MVLEKLRGLRSEPSFVVQLREHKWTSEAQKKELLDKFQALAISPPPMTNMMPRITTTASSSIRLKPLRPRGRGAYGSGRASGSKKLIM